MRIAWCDGGGGDPTQIPTISSAEPTAGFQGAQDFAFGGSLYFGVVGGSGTDVLVCSYLWTPTVADASPTAIPFTVGASRPGQEISWPGFPAKSKGVLSITATINGLPADNGLLATMSPGGSYGAFAWEEGVVAVPYAFWTQFVTTREVI